MPVRTHFHPMQTLATVVLLGLLLVAACAPTNDSTAVNSAEGPSGGPEVTRYAPQNRPDVRGTVGAVSAGHPLAAQAGLAVLQRGGNATDAVIAMAAVLAVTRPHMNGVGGDAFGIFYDGASGEVTALNASGRSGALATPDFFTAAGVDEIPQTGALSVSVPGAVAGWVDAHDRYGSQPFSELLRPAIRFARDGFAVSTRLALDFEAQGGELNGPGRALYLPNDGAPPTVGTLLRNPELAASLETIARDQKDGYYRGSIASRLAAFVEAQGGHLRESDFATHTSTWVDPIRTNYLGHIMLAMPPNTQGPAQLALMGMAREHDLASMGHNSDRYLHTLVELKKLAFADRDRWVADPEHADVPLEQMLDGAYLAQRATLVDPNAAANEVAPGFGDDMSTQEGMDDSGDTVYLTAVDRWGNAVSWIQSNFAGFGSGLLEPETGIILHNRGALYTLENGHPNQVAPGKRPYHTLSPLMALREDGTFAFTLGTPGGDSQPQSLIQIVNNMLMFGMTPQQAIEAPRFRSMSGLGLVLENRVTSESADGLLSRGHELRLIDGWTATFGGAQMIYFDASTGVLTAAADPRREAYALAY